MKIIGIDPGLYGALALLHDDGLDIADMPTVDNNVNGYELTLLVASWGRVDAVAVESQQAFPGQGRSTSFKCGMGWGVVLGVLAALERPIVHVRPALWTRDLRVGADKDAHRRRAMELWPEQASLFFRKGDDGRADAALIARWAADQRVKVGAA